MNQSFVTKIHSMFLSHPFFIPTFTLLLWFSYSLAWTNAVVRGLSSPPLIIFWTTQGQLL